MKRLSEVAGLPLQWVQPNAWREAHELRAGDDLLVPGGDDASRQRRRSGDHSGLGAQERFP